MKKEIRIGHNGLLIGHVYKSSHGGYVAQPNWKIFSQTFLSADKAEEELKKHYQEQFGKPQISQ